MSKKWLVLFILALSVVFVTACEEVPGGASTLSAIVYTGVADAEIENGVEFNFMTGVKAMGNDGVDYTDQITITSTSSAVNVTTKALDTTAVGVHAVRYEVVVGEIVARQFRYITVKSPQVVAGEMLVNKDISQGALGWNDPAVVYIADGASMTLSAEAGELKAVVVAGTNSFTPRFGQMNIPFEQGKTYEVSFDARSSVEKEISLQVGELLTAAPWFNDFLPGTTPFVFRTITTTMQRYYYKFTMTQDNQKGGILFGLGTVKGQKVDATMYFDNFEIVESTPDADTTGPVISGTINRTITVGQAFDPLNGVTASDVTDGDVTSSITVVVKNSNNEVVNSVDTTQPGVFTVTYNVKDSLNNETTLSITVTVSATEPVIYDLPQYRAFVNDWEGSAGTIKGVDGELVLTLTALNALTESWKIQVIQDATAISGAPDNTGHIQFVAGKTYRVTFDAYASVAGNVKLAIGHPGGGWTPYFENAEVAITTEMKSFTYEFTLPAEGDFSTLAQFKIEMGLLFAGLTAPQFFALDNVLIEEKVGEVFQSTTLILNGTMDDIAVEPVVDKLPAPPAGVNHVPATNNVAVGPYDGGAGYTGQLRFVWFEKGTENVKGSELINAPAGLGLEYVYTTFLATLPDGEYTVKFQGVGDGVLGLDSDFSIHTFEVIKVSQEVEEGTSVILDFGPDSKTGYTEGTFTFTNSSNSVEYTFNKDRAQINKSTAAPHDTMGAFLVLAPISTFKEAYVEIDLSAFSSVSSIAFSFTTWSATAFNNITALTNSGTLGLQLYNATTQTWEFVKTTADEDNVISKLDATAYVEVEFTVTQAGRYRLYYNSPDATSTSNTAYAITVDNVKLTYVEAPEAVKLPTPVNGFNHTVATNHVGIGPYAGGTGYTGQLRFVWLEKDTDIVKGTDLFDAPANVGYAYIYTEFLKTLPDGVYTVKFQAVGDQVLGLDSDFFPTTFEVTKAAPVELTYTNSNEIIDGTFTTTTTIVPEVQTNGADTTGIDFWYSYVADWGTARATATIVDGALEVVITNTFNEIWGIMIKQKGIDLVQNTSYRLSFTASSTVARDIRVGFAPGSEQKLFSITDTPTTYTFDFVYTGGNVQSRIEFLLGTGPVSTITLDNIELLIGTPNAS